MILWLNDHIDRDENCRDLKMKFRRITNSFRECLPHVKDRKLFCAIHGKYAKEIVPDIVRIISPSRTRMCYERWHV